MCEYCELMANKDLVLYEDEAVVAALAPKPSGLGHVLVLPREHHTIIEQVPDEVVVRMFGVANQMSLLLFNTLGVKGTNIILENGIAAGQEVAHIGLHIIARLPDDGLNFEWERKEIPDEEMSAVENSIRASLAGVPGSSPQGAQGQPAASGGPPTETIDDDEDNYLTRQLERSP